MAFTARYDGECAICDGSITAGVDMLTKHDGKYVHEGCVLDARIDAALERSAPAAGGGAPVVGNPGAVAGALERWKSKAPAPVAVPTGAAAVDSFFQQAAERAEAPSYTTLEEEVEQKVPRDRWDRPLITQPDGSREPYNRASSYGGQLEDKTNVEKWKVRQTVRGMAILLRQNPSLFAPLPEYLYDPWEDQQSSEKRTLDVLGERAQDAAGSNLKSSLGTDIHYATELVDAGDDLEAKLSIFEPWRKDLLIERANAYHKYTRELGLRWDSIETFGVQDDLKVAGTWDRRGYVPWWPEHRQVIGDVKTSSSMDYAGIGFSVQLATYAHMCEYVIATGERIPHEDMNEDWALIIHVDRNKGGPVEAFKVDIAWGWSAAVYARGVILARREGRKDRITRIDEREALILSQRTKQELLAIEPETRGWPKHLRQLAEQRWEMVP
jgi:hypothetical protein